MALLPCWLPWKFSSHRHNFAITQLASTANQCPCVIVNPLTTHPFHCGSTTRIHLLSFQRISSYLSTREATSATSEPFAELAPPGQYAQTFCILCNPDYNLNKVEHLLKLEGAKERLQLLKADLLEEGSFDYVVEGCDGVFHTASPVKFTFKDPQAELVDPAVKGTLNVVNSCAKSSSVKKVVLTSSIATLIYNGEPRTPDVYVDETWFLNPEFCKDPKRLLRRSCEADPHAVVLSLAAVAANPPSTVPYRRYSDPSRGFRRLQAYPATTSRRRSELLFGIKKEAQSGNLPAHVAAGMEEVYDSYKNARKKA
ncbi:hypothetical protein PIB30_043760 [Stylosanthes scabra]|uniref:3-beta hydroxysteroid dehydrogenase/isomerase domain-containing protein n=1 Tax=Stylosanthes scabra TaxID=79078 RepID=A0ABU6ZED1_9FABA|nr:hypothetical protein [Stylosanthes scabra]